MKPAPFKYARAGSVDEAASLLADYGDEAKVLAGGQSLVPLMSMRLARPDVLVDINAIEALKGIKSNGTLTVGATATQASVLRSGPITQRWPLIGEALRHVGHVGIRSRGTFGGSAAHADPASEIPAVLLALDAELIATSTRGERRIAADDFFLTTFTTALEDDEILTSVRIPPPAADVRWAFDEVARRHGDFALAGVAATAEIDANGVCTKARIALSGVSDTPVRAHEAEAAVVGQKLGEAAEEAGRRARANCDPPSDFHASKQYRTDVAGTLVERAIRNMANQEGAR